MGGIIGSILDPIGEALGKIWDFIGEVLDVLWNGMLISWVIEPIMNFLGFTDEDIYNTDVIAVQVFDDDLYHKTRIDLTLEYMKHGIGGLEYITNFSKTGDSQFGRFYRSGKWDYLDYLPDAQINAVSIPVEKVIEIIEKEQNEKIFLIDIILMTPFDIDWVKFYLQENYNYDIGVDSFKHTDGNYYKFTSTTYNTSGNHFDVVMSTIESIDKKTYEVTITTITSIDENTDNKNVTVYNDILYTRADTGSILEKTSTVVSSINTSVPKGSGVSSIVNNLLSSETITIPLNTLNIVVNNHNSVRMYVVTYTYISNGKKKLWIYNPNTSVHDELNTPSLKVVDFEMLPIVMLRNNFFNINEYETTSKKVGGKTIYRPPSVSEERNKDTENILRSIGMDVSTTIEGYSQNPDIDSIQDGFLLFGVSPSDTNPIVSRALYEMFDFVYDGLPPIDSTAYSAAFKENPYNSAITWIPLPTVIRNEIIGGLGDCKHHVATGISIHNTYSVKVYTTISGRSKTLTTYTLKEVVYEGNILSSNIDTSTVVTTTVSTAIADGTYKTLESTEKSTKEEIVIKKQVTRKQTKTFTLTNFQGLTIIRRGVDNGGKVLNPSDKDLIIPLAMSVVERLTILEKTALLGRSVYLTFYAFEHTHLRWYETEDFASFLKFLTIVIVIVVTIVSWGSATTPAMTLTSVLLATLKAVAIGIALQLALKLIMKFVDNVYLKIALSALAMVVAMYAGGGFDNFDALSAIQLLQIPAMAADIFVKDKVMSLQSDIAKYNKQQEQYAEKNKQNEQLLKSLNGGITSTDIVDLNLNANENYFDKSTQGSIMSPTQFFYVSTTAYLNFDILYQGLYDNSVHNFVAGKLTLGIIGE